MERAASLDRRASQNELQAVRDWRLRQLLRAGFDPQDAALLADHVEIDLHEALRLVERGCPPKTALEILL
jgi:hypothetical protein